MEVTQHKLLREQNAHLKAIVDNQHKQMKKVDQHQKNSERLSMLNISSMQGAARLQQLTSETVK